MSIDVCEQLGKRDSQQKRAVELETDWEVITVHELGCYCSCRIGQMVHKGDFLKHSRPLRLAVKL